MNENSTDPTRRFTSRVADYVRWRPSYPAEVVQCLADETGLPAGSLVADVGAGTGIFSKLLLDAGYRVQAVEPNAAMRDAAEDMLHEVAGFQAIDGTAEQTTLPDQSVDLVTAAQAFHWFDLSATRTEFQRILRPPGRVALIWNSRRLSGSSFLAGYEQLLLEFGTDYGRVRHENVDDNRLQQFFQAPYRKVEFLQEQVLDLEGYLGRLRSSSYVPGPEHPRFTDFIAAAQQLFTKCEKAGTVTIAYDVQVIIGDISAQ